MTVSSLTQLKSGSRRTNQIGLVMLPVLTRVRDYDDSKLNVSEDIKAQFSDDNFSYEVNQFTGSRVNPITGKLLGFSTVDDTWGRFG